MCISLGSGILSQYNEWNFRFYVHISLITFLYDVTVFVALVVLEMSLSI